MANIEKRLVIWPCWFLGIICIGCVGFIWWYCCRTCWSGPVECCPEDFDGKLVIENSETAAWMHSNNGFSWDGTGSFDNYWTGVLVHVGDYDDGDWECENIEFYKEGDSTPVESLSCVASDTTPFYFVNIYAATGGTPITPADHASYLAPWGQDDYCCKVFEGCIGGGGSDCPTKFDECATSTDCELSAGVCRDRRQLHYNQHVRSMIAYWHGPDGYRLEADRWFAGTSDMGTDDNPPLNRYEFLFEDPVVVEIYEFGTSATAGCQWTLKSTFTDVYEVRVDYKSGPPNVVIHKDPPWPTPVPGGG